MVTIQPAVKKETINVAIYTAIGVVLMWIAFVVLSILLPEFWAFEFKVIPSGILGGLVAVLNFLLMGLTVQKVAASADENMARNYMRASYSRRMLLQAAWIIIAIAAPCFQFIAGILPLIFPSLGIKLVGIYNSRKSTTPVTASVESTDEASVDDEATQGIETLNASEEDAEESEQVNEENS